jgi:hypothetical protein
VWGDQTDVRTGDRQPARHFAYDIAPGGGPGIKELRT